MSLKFRITLSGLLQALGFCIIVTTPVIFHDLIVPIVGWERIVGSKYVDYKAGKVVAIGNPLAWIECWLLIAIPGGFIMVIGRVMELSRFKKRSRTLSTPQEKAKASIYDCRSSKHDMEI